MDWTELAAIATAIAAIVTAWMATETRSVAKATTAAALAAAAEAAASRAEAEATAALALEAQRDRELTYLPVPVAKVRGQAGNDAQEVEIQNVGSGPVLSAIYAARNLNAPSRVWFRTGHFHMPPGQARNEIAAAQERDRPPHWFSYPERRDADAVLFCRDVLGRRYRYLIYDGYMFSPDVRRHEDCHVASGEWWGDPVLWPQQD